MLKLIISFLSGGLISWLISHIYYKKASVNCPEWAKPIVEKLPRLKMSNKEIIEHFQKELNKGNAEIDPIFDIVACPKCGESIDKLEREFHDQDGYSVMSVNCPACGWSNSREV